jgi:predicted transcriptional regulator YheO
MKTINDELPLLKAVIRMIALHLGPSCEVVLHDLTKDYQSTIIAIENGDVTGRKVGDPGSNLGLEVLRGLSDDSGDRYNYVTHTQKGQTLRSSSIYIRNDDDEVIGAICINTDVTNLILVENELRKVIGIDWQENQQNKVEEFFVSDVGDLADNMLRSAFAAVGKPQEYLKRADMMEVIEYLDRKGFFLITKSGDKICEVLGISKYTLYKYLEQVRKKYEKPPADAK